MRTFGVYLYLEYKRSVKVLLRSAGSLLLTLCLVTAAAAVISHAVFGARMFRVIDVGVSVPEEEKETRAVVRFLSAMESVESVCNFRYFPQEEALEKLYEGEIQAVIVLPESLYEDMYTGQKGGIKVYLPQNPPFRVQVFQELLSDGVSLLETAEAGVLAARDMAAEGFSEMKPNQSAERFSEMKPNQSAERLSGMKPYQAAEHISYAYIKCAMDRQDIFEKNVYSPLGEMDLYQYYFAAAASLLLLMGGLNYSFLYQGQSRAVEQKLCVLGMGFARISSVKILVMANASWALGTAVYLSGCLFSKIWQMNFLWFHGSVLLWMIPVSFAAAIYFHAVFSVFGKGMQGAVFLLSINALMALCSGIFIPLPYLPDIVGRIGKYLPLNYLHRYFAEIFF